MTHTALIVGASRGLGLGLVAEYLSRGWTVLATVRDASGEAALKALTGSERVSVHFADVTSDADIARLSSDLPGGLDAVFINAGVYGPSSLTEASLEDLDAVMRTNAFGPIRLAHALLGHLKPNTGVLALMSSVMGSIAETESGFGAVYRATKAAQNSLARSLWADEGRKSGITVLSVHPGWVRTDMGGPGADIDVETSVAGMVDQLAAAVGRHDHRFVAYDGREIGW